MNGIGECDDRAFIIAQQPPRAPTDSDEDYFKFFMMVACDVHDAHRPPQRVLAHSLEAPQLAISVICRGRWK